MMKKLYLILCTFSVLALSAQPANYYDGTSGLTGYALKTKLHEIISNGHLDRGYGGLWNAYKVGDLDKFYENDNSILDIYSEKPLSTDSYSYTPGNNQCGSSTPASEGGCYNREHLFPQGFFNEDAPMKNDYHHVRPTDNVVNGKRSNYPFGTVGNATWTSTNGSKLGISNFPGYGGTVFEPIDEFKGDVARSLLYFITRYEDRVQNFETSDVNNPQDGTRTRVFEQWYINLLLNWHQKDPVSAFEIARNNYAYTYQGNRNPFVDRPEFVSMIWTSTLSTANSNLIPNLRIIQNPVKNGQIKLEGKNLASVKSVQIISATGQVIQSLKEPFKNGDNIQLTNLTKGIYFLKVDDQLLKFIVE